MSFKNYYDMHTGDNHRHRKPFTSATGSRGYQRKHVNLVPKYAQNNASDNSSQPTFIQKNPKIENLKKQPGMYICDDNDVAFITKNFLKGARLQPGEKKTLGGNMGISYYINPQGKHVIERQ